MRKIIYGVPYLIYCEQFQFDAPLPLILFTIDCKGSFVPALTPELLAMLLISRPNLLLLEDPREEFLYSLRRELARLSSPTLSRG